MKLPKLKNVRIVDKPPKKRYEDSDLYEKSSSVVTYNLFENEWDDLQREGLTHIFNHDKDLFEKRREEAKCTKENLTEIETTEEVDETFL